MLGRAQGKKDAGRFKPQRGVREVGRGDAKDFGPGGWVFRDGERRRAAVDESDGGRVAVGKLGCEAKAEARTRYAQLVLAHFVEDASAVAENDGNAGRGIPDDVAEAAQAGEVDVNAIPIGVKRDVLGRAKG